MNSFLKTVKYKFIQKKGAKAYGYTLGIY